MIEHLRKINQKIEGLKIINVIDAYNPLQCMFQKDTHVGIDIGTHAIKVVQLQESQKNISLVKFGYKELSSSLEGDHITQKNELIRHSLRDLLKELKIKTDRVSVTISDSAVTTQLINVLRLAEDELIRAVKWQAEKYISYPIEDAVVDFQPLAMTTGNDSDRMDISLILAHKDTINRYIEILHDLNMTPVALDITPCALLKAHLKTSQADPEKMIALIDIGATRSILSIVKGEALLFLRVIDIGGNDFTHEISAGRNISFHEAEELKKTSSINGDGALYPHIEAPLTQLIGDINRSFAYCEVEVLIERVNQAIIFGGGALLKGLDAVMAEKLGLPVELGNICANDVVKTNKADVERIKTIEPQIAAAFGAALK
ncbi:type IV pilus assembly protein PilM [Candidatus Omnitrophota bacterium]